MTALAVSLAFCLSHRSRRRSCESYPARRAISPRRRIHLTPFRWCMHPRRLLLTPTHPHPSAWPWGRLRLAGSRRRGGANNFSVIGPVPQPRNAISRCQTRAASLMLAATCWVTHACCVRCIDASQHTGIWRHKVTGDAQLHNSRSSLNILNTCLLEQRGVLVFCHDGCLLCFMSSSSLQAPDCCA